MNKWILRLISPLFCAFQLAAQTNLPVVNVTVLKSLVPEGSPGYFIFTSDQKSNLAVYFRISGSATTNDFDETIRNPFVFGGSIQIPASSYVATLTMRPIIDGLIEPVELVTLKLLPSPFYTIGGESEATLEILDQTSPGTPTNSPSVFLLPPATNLVPNTPITFVASIIDTNSTNVTVQLFIDDAMVAQRSILATNEGVVRGVSLDWPNPKGGAHTARVYISDDRGSSADSNARDFFVYVGLLTPTRTFTFGPSVGYSPGVSATRTPPSDYDEGYVEFAMPPNATNTRALLHFHASIGDRVEIFAYPAGPTNRDEVLALPREFVGVLGSNATNVELDITHWARKYASTNLGLVFSIPPELESYATFDNFVMSLVSEGFVEPPFDEAPSVRLLDSLAELIVTNSLTLNVEISDPDSRIASVVLFDNGSPIATNAPPNGYEVGTNVLNFVLPDITTGPHFFVLRTTSLDKSTATGPFPTYITRSDLLPKHHWLGSQDGSSSFYVVDAAGRAHVWGHNEFGQLGLNWTGGYLKRPATVLPPAGHRIFKIASSATQAFALMDDGSVFSLGESQSDVGGVQTGLNLIPPPSGVPYFRAISTERFRAAAIDPLGNVYLLGALFGSSRVITTEIDTYVINGPAPQDLPTSLHDFAHGSWPFSYAITKEHQLYYWTNTTSTGALRSLEVPGVTGWQRVVTSWFATVAMDDSGKIWSWSPIGSGITAPEPVPFPKPITNWLDISVSGQSVNGMKIAMALSAEGELYAWGQAYKGVWTDPAASVANVPELVPGLPDLLDPNATAAAAPILASEVTPTGLSIRVLNPTQSQLHFQTSTDLVHWTNLANISSQSRLGVTTITLPLVTTGAQFMRIAP